MMRALDIRDWAIPVLLALLLNAVLFLCIPGLSSRKEMEKKIDFSDPILISIHDPPLVREIKELPRPPEAEEPPRRVQRSLPPTQRKIVPALQARIPARERKPSPKPPRAERKAKAAPSPPVRQAPTHTDVKPMEEPSSIRDPAAPDIRPSTETDVQGSVEETTASDSIGPATEMGVGEVDQAPVVVSRVEPIYPPIARRSNREGKVVVRFLVDADGWVRKVSIVEARPGGLFEKSVLEAIGKWRFKPGRYRGRAVSTWIVVPIYFKLTG